MSENSGVMAIPLESVLMLVSELKSNESCAASLMQYHFSIAKDEADWNTTPIPELCEYYTGCRQLTKIIMMLLSSPTPKDISHEEAEGKLVMEQVEYRTLTTLLAAVTELKDGLRWSHNISFEVH